MTLASAGISYRCVSVCLSLVSSSFRVLCRCMAQWSNCWTLWWTWNNTKTSTPYRIWWFKFHQSIMWILLS